MPVIGEQLVLEKEPAGHTSGLIIDVNYMQTIKVVTIMYIHCSFRGVGAKLKVVRLNFMVSSWQSFVDRIGDFYNFQ